MARECVERVARECDLLFFHEVNSFFLLFCLFKKIFLRNFSLWVEWMKGNSPNIVSSWPIIFNENALNEATQQQTPMSHSHPCLFLDGTKSNEDGGKRFLIKFVSRIETLKNVDVFI